MAPRLGWWTKTQKFFCLIVSSNILLSSDPRKIIDEESFLKVFDLLEKQVFWAPESSKKMDKFDPS